MKESKLEDFYNEVAAFLSKDGISDDPAILDSYAQDESFCDRLAPAFITWPTTTRDVQLIIQSATKFAIPLVPVSSGPGFRQHADTVPNQEGSVVVDLSKMNHILRIDRINRVVMVEAGVTFAQLLPELAEQDLRLLQPLCPRGNKSVVTSALEREPTLIPRYQWDASDPLLCMELVFGTGDVFRTGSAAGPGSIEEQLATGQAQKNPLGPAQFNLFQTIQGAQGSLGIVTWATLKCELQPTQQKILYVQVADLRLLIDFAYELLKFRMGDEMFLMNKLAF
ncbi:MAG TPA: FAD-binding oxidoreductase, partial [Candidatus Lokiarchaeia archaeon]|nr:FAD-binding oxidoreductase [Candidatus Lokiarchaeia archaeon]